MKTAPSGVDSSTSNRRGSSRAHGGLVPCTIASCARPSLRTMHRRRLVAHRCIGAGQESIHAATRTRPHDLPLGGKYWPALGHHQTLGARIAVVTRRRRKSFHHRRRLDRQRASSGRHTARDVLRRTPKIGAPRAADEKVVRDRDVVPARRSGSFSAARCLFHVKHVHVGRHVSRETRRGTAPQTGHRGHPPRCRGRCRIRPLWIVSRET